MSQRVGHKPPRTSFLRLMDFIQNRVLIFDTESLQVRECEGILHAALCVIGRVAHGS